MLRPLEQIAEDLAQWADHFKGWADSIFLTEEQTRNFAAEAELFKNVARAVQEEARWRATRLMQGYSTSQDTEEDEDAKTYA